MTKTIARPVSDARLGQLVRRQRDRDRELKDVQRQIDAVELRSARPLLEGRPPGPAPELPTLIERRAELFAELRLIRRAIALARGAE